MTVFGIVKWPVIALIVSQIFAFLYWITPNVKQPGYKWVSPGGILAVVLWIAASALFAFYVANFGSYSKTYGSMAAAIIFLVWLWITNVVMLLGLEFNAETERGRQIEAGHDPEVEPFLPHREVPKAVLTCDLLVTYCRRMTDDDLVFKALADPTRRFLLDLLFERDGRTLTELESELEMTRFGVMKHLRRARGRGPRRHPAVGPGEAALPQSRPDPADPRPVDRQVHGAPRLGARRSQDTNWRELA